MDGLPTGTVTFLFSDIEGSTRLAQRLGPDAFTAVVEAHQAILRAAFEEHRGRTIQTEGDSFFVVFERALDAVRASAAGQARLAGASWPAEAGPHGLKVRMGLHTGEARLGGANYVGLDVHRAARIAAAANGGQVVASSSTRSLVERDLPAGLSFVGLGLHRLRDLDRPEDLGRLRIDGIDDDSRPPRTLELPTNLPVELTSLVGRERVLARVGELVRANRLVTLTGPGGTGKTRLAIATAGALRDAFPDGAWLVELASITDPALVPGAIASALAIKVESDRSIETLLGETLRDRRALIVLDNFEQVVAAAPAVASLLGAASNLHVLVTSREVLHVRGEQEVAIPPLELPPPEGADRANPERVMEYEAVALFVARAQAVDSEFGVTAENADAIARICSRLDGLPLAIELAAARVKVFPPVQLLARLDRSTSMLSSLARDLPERQRTLEGTIAWSYDLLSGPEQVLFRRLGPFVGGWTLGAAEAVADPDGSLGVDLFDGLVSLHDKSLVVRVVGPDGEPRFRFLELIRAFAAARLDETNEAHAIRGRHAAWACGLLATSEAGLVGPEAARWQELLDGEIDNLRAGLRWAIEHDEATLAQDAVAAGWRFWHQTGRLSEARATAAAVLDLPSGRAATVHRVRALSGAGGIAYWQGDFVTADAWYREGLALARELDDRPLIAEALYNTGFTALTLGDPAAQRSLHEAAVAMFLDLGDDEGAARARQGLTVNHLRAGELTVARDLEAENVAHFTRSGALFRAADGLTLISAIETRLGDWPAARGHLRQALGIFESADVLSGVTGALEVTSAVLAEDGSPERAARLIGATARMREDSGAFNPAIKVLGLADPADRARAELGDARFAELRDAGRRMDRAAALADALDALSGA